MQPPFLGGDLLYSVSTWVLLSSTAIRTLIADQ
jgi:hypothetical protein